MMFVPNFCYVGAAMRPLQQVQQAQGHLGLPASLLTMQGTPGTPALTNLCLPAGWQDVPVQQQQLQQQQQQQTMIPFPAAATSAAAAGGITLMLSSHSTASNSSGISSGSAAIFPDPAMPDSSGWSAGVGLASNSSSSSFQTLQVGLQQPQQLKPFGVLAQNPLNSVDAEKEIALALLYQQQQQQLLQPPCQQQPQPPQQQQQKVVVLSAPPACGAACTVFFAGVSPIASAEALLSVFAKFGRVMDLNLFKPYKLSKTSKGCGLVTYHQHSEAADAIQALNGRYVWPGARSAMVVEWSDGSKKEQPVTPPTGPRQPQQRQQQQPAALPLPLPSQPLALPLQQQQLLLAASGGGGGATRHVFLQ